MLLLSMYMSREEGIETVYPGPSHVVILGAGASIASARHNPEPSGKTLPSMENLIDVVGLRSIIGSATGNDPGRRNFEAVYSDLYQQSLDLPIVEIIEGRAREYFSLLRLPETPTIYDYLVLALRPKDFIATFNWDPFLYQALCRNRHIKKLPHTAFLHGNVAIGYSSKDRKAGPVGYFSKETGEEFEPTKLLYPITKKNYSEDEFIAREWTRLRRELKSASRLTIFGYSAPTSDAEAVELMRSVWGESRASKEEVEWVEIIDILPREQLSKRWRVFIHSQLYNCWSDYFQSVLARFPRRTGERYIHQSYPLTPAQGFQEENPVPQFKTLKEMWDWHSPLIQAELKALGESEPGLD